MLRRWITIPLCLMAALLAMVTVPLWLPASWLVDRLTGAATRRAGLMVAAGLVLDALALLALLAVFGWGLVTGSLATEADRSRNFAVQRWWTRSLLGAGAWIYQLALEVEGDEAVEPGPLVVLSRHTSVADTLLPAVLLADRHRMLLRYVAKEELRWEPCLDVLGSRLGTLFVRRGDPGRDEGERLGRAVRGLGAREGLLIFPEGTRFTPEKRDRYLARLEARGDPRAGEARALRHLLPPRLGGTLALLEGNPGADVLLVQHRGLEGLGTLADLARRDLVGRRVQVSFRRFAFAGMPRGREALEAWLLARWREMDAWIEAGQARPPGTSRAGASSRPSSRWLPRGERP
jgi:1-acyl-sn-glycerol-3-phosphate acyltransferase